jgi:hypothetical protein
MAQVGSFFLIKKNPFQLEILQTSIGGHLDTKKEWGWNVKKLKKVFFEKIDRLCVYVCIFELDTRIEKFKKKWLNVLDENSTHD